MKDIETVVSENIKKLLKEYNVNQTELSKIAGVSESTVGKWVLKKATPRMGAIQKISDHFNIPKSYILEETEKELPPKMSTYSYYPTSVSAGLPTIAEPVSKYDVENISIPDNIMGKWANCKDIYMMRINGESMNKVIPNGSLIAVKPVEVNNLKNGDIVVYSDNYDYAVKRYYLDKDRIIFRPDSHDNTFYDYVTNVNNSNLKIHGKVVLYIVELD
ncbi:XRE family transcriptional regulator [Caldifermentibacillus hisashii]|uniref:LexA family protein n=1 Tax=Caldifermentibacillus hisashii TaxID=996558 RepID=UPI0031FC6C38